MSDTAIKENTRFRTVLDLQGMNGLSEADARQRLETAGPNELPSDMPRGGDAVTLGKDDEVPGHDLTFRGTAMSSVADDERSRAGEITQGVEGPLGASLLDDGDGHDDQHTDEQHRSASGTWAPALL